MDTTNLERLNEFFGARGVTAALLSNPWTIAWLTGYAPPIQTGPSPFEGGPARAELGPPDVFGVVLYPTGLRIVLGKRLLCGSQDGAVMTEHDRPGTSGPLV